MIAAPATRRPSQLDQAQARAGAVFILPTALLYATFVLAPVVVTGVLAFAYYDPMMGSRWVGLDNFSRFFTDRRSLQILWNTLRFTLFAVTFNGSIGLILALALNRAMPDWLLYLFRLAFFLPVIIAAAFVSIVWTYFFADDLGVINYCLRLIGLPDLRWLTDARHAMTSIILMNVWKNTGFFMVIFIAASQGVPKNILEAATMDGTPAWRQFLRITLADQIVVPNEGRVEQTGSPVELYARPANLFVARFLGAPPMSLLAGKTASQNGQRGILLDDGPFIALPCRELPDEGAAVTLGIRPEHVTTTDGMLPMTVSATEVLGSETVLHGTLTLGKPFTITRRGISRAGAGDKLAIGVPPDFAHVFDAQARSIGATADWRPAYLR